MLIIIIIALIIIMCSPPILHVQHKLCSVVFPTVKHLPNDTTQQINKLTQTLTFKDTSSVKP